MCPATATLTQRTCTPRIFPETSDTTDVIRLISAARVPSRRLVARVAGPALQFQGVSVERDPGLCVLLLRPGGLLCSIRAHAKGKHRPSMLPSCPGCAQPWTCASHRPASQPSNRPTKVDTSGRKLDTFGRKLDASGPELDTWAHQGGHIPVIPASAAGTQHPGQSQRTRATSSRHAPERASPSSPISLLSPLTSPLPPPPAGTTPAEYSTPSKYDA